MYIEFIYRQLHLPPFQLEHFFFLHFFFLLLYIFLVNSSSEKLYSKFIYSIASDFHYHIIYFNLKDLLITNLYKMLYYLFRYLFENE